MKRKSDDAGVVVSSCKTVSILSNLGHSIWKQSQDCRFPKLLS